MPEAPGFVVLETLYRGGRSTLRRARRSTDGRVVLLKEADPRRSNARDVARLRNELELGRMLDGRVIVRPIELITHAGVPTLVLEDFHGAPLDRIPTPMPIGTFLAIAVRIAGALADVHRQGVVHRDLKPENILVDVDTLEARIADFGLATRLPREQRPPQPPRRIEGSLPYLSPEQTGRMNRAVDGRSDLYSLGVTFHRMLTGRLPFEAHDPLEWVHCHVARAPPSPRELVPEIPETIARIVLKLLAKMADERYQTARGLQLDLERCLAQWRVGPRIVPFPLAERDVPDRLQIPQKLYGREADVAALLGAFARIGETGAPELVLVSGYSGIGKSSVVNELQKALVRSGGLFVSGKFDELARGIPYSTIARALSELVLWVLADDEACIRERRNELRAALGPNGKLLVDLIPPLGQLVGEQPLVPELPAPEAEQRFRRVFRDFLRVFTKPHRPLVLFLDDLQWADAGSLALVEYLVTDPDTRHLLLIGAYRDREVEASHPLGRMLERVRRARAAVHERVLSPLGVEDLVALLADAIRTDRESVRPLAALVHEKTGGNPFFAIRFLTTLYAEGLLALDGASLEWRWDLARIRAKGYTDNVAEFMARRLSALPAPTRRALTLAACMGNKGRISVLAVAHGKSQRETLQDLREAFLEGLVLSLEDSFAFAHDRVQQAAYAAAPEEERAAIHLRIGRLLLARTPPEELQERIFEIVNQLDRGAVLIATPEERDRVAELNLAAGERARAASAYASALQYLAAGRSLLGDDAWSRRPEVAFALELRRAECESVTGERTAAEARLTTLARRATNVVDAAAVACVQVALFSTLDRPDLAVEAGLGFLRRLGVEWSAHPPDALVRDEYELLWRRIGTRSIEELIDLPTMHEPEWRATLEVLMRLQPPARFTDENLLCLLAARIANISLEHGNADASCLGYVGLGTVLGPRFGDYRAAFRFGRLALDLVDKRGFVRFRPQVYLAFGYFVSPWTSHLREAIGLTRRAFDAARESGEVAYASYASYAGITLALSAGEPLADVEGQLEAALAFARKVKFGLIADMLTSQRMLVRALRGEVRHLSSSSEREGEEQRFEAHLQADRRRAVASCDYGIRKLQARFFAGDRASALDAAAHAEPLLWTSISFFTLAEYHQFGALALAMDLDAAAPDERARAMSRIHAHLEQLERWARSCPENFADHAALVAAEAARLDGETGKAASLYEQAIHAARESGFVHGEALAYELASGFYRSHGFALIADAYLREALGRYERWGADAKVRQLEKLHPHVVERRLFVPTATFATRTEQLDLLAVVKASQTISSRVVIEDLVCTLLQVALEQGGGRKGYLILARNGALTIEAEAALDERGTATRILPSSPVESTPLLPASVVQYARLAKQDVILDDPAGSATRFAADPYFERHRPLSVLCVPILRQEQLLGLLYLENELAPGAFTPERLTALTLLATQAAISMENALLLARERAARTAAEAAERRSTFLAKAGPLLSASLDYEETLSRLVRLCVESLAETCLLDVVEGREIRRIACASSDPGTEALLERLERRHPARWDSAHPSAICLRTGEPLLRSVIDDEFIRTHCDDEEHVELVRGIRTRSIVVVPLIARGQRLGAFTLGSSTPGRFGQADVELAQEVASRAAVAIDNARLHREVQQADRRKSEFLAMLSHELRNPLTPIVTGLHLLDRAPADSPLAARCRDAMKRQASHLSRLVDDLLDVTRITSGNIRLDRTRVELRDAVRQVCDDVREHFERVGVALRVDLPEEPIWLEVDATRLAQVVSNLLHNAAKFTPQGGSVVASVTACDGRAEIRIQDTGIGMASDEVERMFEPFAQADQDLARTQGGLGLGLTLAKRLVEMHGGTIRGASAGRGRGSEFVVTLPLLGREHATREAVGQDEGHAASTS